MTYLLKQIFSFLHLLNSDKGHKSIAAGIACGFILGMTSGLSLQSVFIFIVLFLFRIQIGAALISAFFFTFIAWVLDPIFHTAGTFILETESLKPLFTSLYNQPILPLTRFYNTIVMGSGVISFILCPVIYFISLYLVKKYRQTIVERFKSTKLWKFIKATSLFKWYSKYEELRG